MRSLQFITCFLSLTLLLAGSQIAAGQVYIPGKSCDIVVSDDPGDFSSIQSAVDAADSGDVVCVEASGGPYVEQVVINKDLTLKGKGNPTIELPGAHSGFIIPESGQEWEPVVFAFGGSLSAHEVSGSGTVDVSISGFHIDGANLQPDRDKGVRPRLAGILYRNVQSTGGITENTVDNLANGGKENFGVAVYGDSDVTISSNTVSGYERGGIFVTGGEGGPAPNGRIRNNNVTAFSGGNWAPNGIQIGGGAQGDVINNTVKNNVHPRAASGAILVVESDEIKVRGNSADNNDYGVGMFTFFEEESSADNNKVTDNEVTGANTWGVIIGTIAAESTADNNKITNNTLKGDGSFGVLLFGSAENNQVIANSISGFDTDVGDFGDESKVQATNPGSP